MYWERVAPKRRQSSQKARAAAPAGAGAEGAGGNPEVMSAARAAGIGETEIDALLKVLGLHALQAPLVVDLLPLLLSARCPATTSMLAHRLQLYCTIRGLIEVRTLGGEPLLVSWCFLEHT